MQGMETLTPVDKVFKAQIKLQSECPFFAYLLMSCRIYEAPGIGTMGVDKFGNMPFEPSFVASITDDELKACLCHEVVHLVLDHVNRNGLVGANWDLKILNIAQDIVVNWVIGQEGFKLPNFCYIPSGNSIQIKQGPLIQGINKKTSEAIYEEIEKFLKQNPPPPGGGGGQGQPDPSGKPMPGQGTGPQGEGIYEGRLDDHKVDKPYREDPETGKTDTPDGELKNRWRKRISQAATVARQQGKMPGSLAGMLDDILEPRVDWNQKLYRFIVNDMMFDFTYSRPAKKSFSTGVYMPNVLKENIELVCHIDTSGSMAGHVESCISQMYYLLNAFNQISIDLVFCDRTVDRVYRMNRQDAVDIAGIKFGGYGGTSHQPVVKWINDNRPGCRLFVSLTDCMSDIQHAYPDLPTCCHSVLVVPSKDWHHSEGLDKYAELIKMN